MSRERRAVSSLAVLGLFVAAAGVLTWAWGGVQTSSANFGDHEVLDRNHLGAGTVDIALGDDTVRFDVAHMAAGDVRAGHLELTNQGTFPLRYTVSAASAGGPLADVIELALWLRTGPVCPQQVPPAGAGPWMRPSQLATAPTIATARALAPGESDVLCMLGRLPLSAPSSAQGQELELSVVVSAEHDVGAS